MGKKTLVQGFQRFYLMFEATFVHFTLLIQVVYYLHIAVKFELTP